MPKLTPIEELFYKLIKKGVNNYPELQSKTSKSQPYVYMYGRQLESKGLIKRKMCEHCNTGIILTIKK